MATLTSGTRPARLSVWLVATVLGFSLLPLAAAQSAPSRVSFTASAGERWVATFASAAGRGAAQSALAGNLIRQFDDTRLILRGSRTGLEQALLNAQAAWTGNVLVEPDIWVKPTAVDPNDTLYATYQWDMKAQTASSYGIGLPDARARFSAGNVGKGVAVAILDTGIVAHSDLPALPSSWAGSGIGWDFVSNDNDPRDPGDYTSTSSSSWHGTHVAGTIAAQTDNSKGVAGIAPDVTLQYARVLGPGGGNFTDITDALKWASGQSVTGRAVTPTPISQRADVVNLSLGGTGSCPTYFQSAANAAKANGTLVVVAAGNSNANASGFTPANCNGVVTVASIGPTGQRAYYSNYGSTVEIAAQGGDANYVNGTIRSTLNSGTTTPSTESYAGYQGTSMATPHVVGVAALVLSLYEQLYPGQTLTPAQVESVLYASVVGFPLDTASSFPCSTAGNCGAGILNAAAALNNLPQPPAATAYTLTGPAAGLVNSASGNFTVTPNGPFTGTITVNVDGGGYSNQSIPLSFSGSAAPQNFTITPTSLGTVTLSAADDQSLTDPAPVTYNAAAAATGYSLSGPSNGLVGVASNDFTVTMNGYFVGTVNVAVSGAGLSSSVPVVFDGTQTSKTFKVTPLDVGTATLTPSNSAALSNQAAVNYSVTTSATSYTLTGPQSLSVGTAGTFTVTPNGTFKGTVNLTWSGTAASGSTSLNFNNSSTAQTFTITPSSSGSVTVAATAAPALGATAVSNPTALSYTIVGLPGSFGKTSPANGATNIARSGSSLTWAAAAGATSYQVCLTTGTTCSTWTSVGTATTWRISGTLKSRTTYRWQVRAVNSAGNTVANGGTLWSFTSAR